MTDPVFLVTGAASGIGLHLTSRLAARGHRILATDLEDERLAAVARDAGWPADRVRRAALDVRDTAAWAAAFEDAAGAFGGVDTLLHVAGYLKVGVLHEAGADEVHRHFDVNTKGTAFALQAAAAHMIPRGGGHVVVVSSISALAAVPGLGLYSASKFASRALCLAAGHELKRYGVAVTVLCPDGVETPMTERIRGDAASAVVFSGGGLLSVEAIGDVVLGKVLRKRPREVVLPAYRGWIARFANLSPGVHGAVMTHLERLGRRRMLSASGPRGNG